MHEKLKKVISHEFVFYFRFCIEFVIKLLNLLKKSELVCGFDFFEIELVCGFDFFFCFVLCFVLFVG